MPRHFLISESPTSLRQHQEQNEARINSVPSVDLISTSSLSGCENFPSLPRRCLLEVSDLAPPARQIKCLPASYYHIRPQSPVFFLFLVARRNCELSILRYRNMQPPYRYMTTRSGWYVQTVLRTHGVSHCYTKHPRECRYAAERSGRTQTDASQMRAKPNWLQSHSVMT